jgi:2-phosphosulfolactate phosphatase
VSLRVAFTPGSIPVPVPDICVVIDVLRATSTLVTMFAQGLDEAFVAPSIKEARSLARERNLLLCGEQGGIAPEGFDYGNSPAAFSRVALHGRRAVLATTNGTVALTAARARSAVLVGSLLNAGAVIEALRQAGAEDILILCSGEERGRLLCAEDVYCAGAIVDGLMVTGSGTDPADDALIARSFFRSHGSAGGALASTKHGAQLAEIGFAEDVAFCAQRDRYAVVPRVEAQDEGVPRVVAGSGCPQ